MNTYYNIILSQFYEKKNSHFLGFLRFITFINSQHNFHNIAMLFRKKIFFFFGNSDTKISIIGPND